MIALGLLIIAIGAFCQSSSYVPINKIRSWSWESFWLVQGVFAWIVFPALGTLLSIPEGESLGSLFRLLFSDEVPTLLIVFFGMLWGVGGLTFGLSMRYLGVSMGQSVALGTCAALGTVLTPLFTGHAETLTGAVIAGVAATLLGIGVIGVAGQMRASQLSKEAKRASVKDFNFTKGIAVALTAGFMSACFNIGLGLGEGFSLPSTAPIFSTLPATALVTAGGFLTNAAYCLFQNARNKTFSDYAKAPLWGNNLLFCSLAGLLWYSQFFGLSLGKGFLVGSATLTAFSWCILMALNVTFSNVWGLLLKEWRGCPTKTIAMLLSGIVILIISSFLPQLL